MSVPKNRSSSPALPSDGDRSFAPIRDDVILVDGYNVLRSSGRYAAHLAQTGDHSHDVYNAAREALISDVALFSGRRRQATIVFDGAGNPYSEGRSQRVGNIEVIFSAAGVSADSVIENLARSARGRGAKVLVITSDAQTQWTVLGDNVARMSAAGFVIELEALVREQRDDAVRDTVKTTLSERLDPRTRARMEALRETLTNPSRRS
jgi:predicted RNA-binding protein with PIN domain